MATLKKNNYLTIGIPVYNGEKFLAKRIKNIKDVTKVKHKIIISDNCSDDKTELVCRKLEKKFNNITYIRQKQNIGPVENFRFLINLSKSKYFVFAGVDDVWNKNFIDDCYKLITNDDVAIAFSNFLIADTKSINYIPMRITPSVSNSPYFRLLNRFMDPVPHLIYGLINKELYNTTFIKNMDFFDIYFTFCMSLKGKILISNNFNFKWQIDGHRKSYSISKKRMQYYPFFLGTLKILRGFSFAKQIFIFSIFLRWVIYNIYNRIFNPKIFDVKF